MKKIEERSKGSKVKKFKGLLLFILFCLLTFKPFLYSQVSKVGTSGAKFLSIGIDPRGVGMGYAFTAVTNDVTSLYWNPAGIAVPKKSEFFFSDVEWFLDIRNNFLGYIMPLKGQNSSIGASITALTMGEEEITTIEEPEGTGCYWSANSIAIGLSYARWFTNEFSFGVSVKFIRESIWELSSMGGAVDIGILLYPSLFKNLKIGASMTNFGTDMQFKGAKEDVFREDWPSGTGGMEVEPVSRLYSLPLCVKLGIAYNILTSPENKLIWALDLSHLNDGPEKWHTGIEYGWNNMFFLRAGFTYDPNLWDDWEGEYDAEEYAAGVGFRYLNYVIDYAAEDRGRLGIKHRFALKLEL